MTPGDLPIVTLYHNEFTVGNVITAQYNLTTHDALCLGLLGIYIGTPVNLSCQV